MAFYEICVHCVVQVQRDAEDALPDVADTRRTNAKITTASLLFFDGDAWPMVYGTEKKINALVESPCNMCW